LSASSPIDSDALGGLRRRGQFLFSALLWASAAGFLLFASAYLLIIYHYVLVLAERLRAGFGWHAPPRGPDWLLLAILATLPALLILAALIGWTWYRRAWNRKLKEVWPDATERRLHGRWRPLLAIAGDRERQERSAYLAGLQSRPIDPSEYERHAEAVLADLEKDIAERAVATGLVVGVSHNRSVDLFTIFAATLELQLHVLCRLGKRPSGHAWRMLIQRCGASLFINSYLNRQDSLMLNLLIKKTGMGLNAAGDLMQAGASHLADSDIDLDEALGLPHGGLVGLATRSIEVGATMALSVGQVGLHTLGTLIESVGDELTQGAVAAGIIYFHGISLAADTLALDRRHRASQAMNRDLRKSFWKMGEVAGSILLDFIRQRRSAFRERRRQVVRSLPRTAYERVQALFGRKPTTALPE
jgi:hypothetical protein